LACAIVITQLHMSPGLPCLQVSAGVGSWVSLEPKMTAAADAGVTGSARVTDVKMPNSNALVRISPSSSLLMNGFSPHSRRDKTRSATQA
jgi:hypothetical protein